VVILHAAARYLVIVKPTGLLSVPGIGEANADCVAVRVRRLHPEARIVHRLDQATSGLLVMARDLDALRALSRQFELRTVEKEYLAVVAGLPEAEEGLIDLPMRKDMERRARQLIDHQRGKRALTRWQVLRREPDRSLLLLHPETGRSHQLRLHLASIGHPILGDTIYAPAEIAAAATRLLLHASRLAFDDPAGGRVSFECPWDSGSAGQE
jgi:tRNA pseudouridine32 synthase/23S rRNA pseudouridine746 synthase